ncbi:hypothetical protein PTKU64_88170 [Paraburkholderia terrae]|uniref:Uncharacterized protein n=1 Tax=Paraburkholderia terrae TaxID=311230 RepID=A0ABN6JW09_9BURK|nr:hypothetical protein PTKU64_88170 [Paraburkholderia terrae]
MIVSAFDTFLAIAVDPYEARYMGSQLALWVKASKVAISEETRYPEVQRCLRYRQ